MNKTIQTVAFEELNKENLLGSLPVLIDIYNPDIVWEEDFHEQENMHLRLINDTALVKYKGKTYLPCALEFEPPEVDGTNIGTGKLSISSIGTGIIEILETCDGVFETQIVSVFAKSEENSNSFLFYPLNTWKFYFNSGTYTKTVATLTLMNKDILTTNVPRDVATLEQLHSVNTNANS